MRHTRAAIRRRSLSCPPNHRAFPKHGKFNQMRLQSIRLSNFQSFGPEAQDLTLTDMTYLIGPNGSCKTAALQALCRLFAFNPSLRRIRRSDFHVPYDEEEAPDERQLWIEAEFIFPETENNNKTYTVAPFFRHMRMDSINTLPRVRYRLDAIMGTNGDIEEKLVYVLSVGSDGTPLSTRNVPRNERNQIHVHYLPARRDPAEHIAYSTNALLGRLIRSVTWGAEEDGIKDLTNEINKKLTENSSITRLSEVLRSTWTPLHKSSFFSDPKITFSTSEIETLLQHLSISFSPGHGEKSVDYSRLSDGQKSMLYLSLVLASQSIGRAVLDKKNDSFDADKLLPPVFTIIALEEPENSLSPHYLGRIVNALSDTTSHEDAQALVATHAPSMLRRVPPGNIRYLRITEQGATKINCIDLPDKIDEAHKFVREAVQAYPEIYFSRLVILGEGDSEQIILPRILQAKGIPVDEYGITIAPLGGRHVNHFWRLLSSLEIPYVTLLDLDIARFGGGWGRISDINKKLIEHTKKGAVKNPKGIPSWNSKDYKIRNHKEIIADFESRGVFFSYPMDIDFSMLIAFQDKYNSTKSNPSDSTIKAVLGKKYFDETQYKNEELELFEAYHKCFKLSSKPATHLEALSNLEDKDLLKNMPESLSNLAEQVRAKLEKPE